MAYPTDRVQLFDRDMNPLRELAPSEVFSRVRTEEINGEHSLVITTTRRLEEGWRALTVDGTGKWREWVLTEPDQLHESGKTAVGTYRFVWSLQYDLTYSYYHDTGMAVSIGLGMSTTAIEAAGHVLEGVAGWSVGPCDAADIAAGTGCVFIRESAWSKLSKLVECSGVEVDSVIEVSNLYGVTARKLCLNAHVGSEEALRRFDWSEDLTSIRRTPSPGPYYCRVVPLGKGQTEYADDDETTYEYPIDITEEPDGQGGFHTYYIQDDEAAIAFRIKAGDGTYVYPTIAVTYSEDDPELVLNAALKELYDYTRPSVTYEASIAQFAQAGMDAHGVALGDEVQCVDYGFNPDAALRIQGRVIKIEVDELSPETTTQLTIGELRDSMTDLLKDMGKSLDQLQANNDRINERMRSMTTARYIDELLDRINAEINATGGYAYFVPGEGIITYDVAVADPLVGSEASQVVQVKGGSIRIANSKKTAFAGIDDWEWTSVFTADGINSSLVRAVQIISGYIGDATNSNYWNLDTGELVLRMFYNTTSGSETLKSGDSILTKHGYMAIVDASVYSQLTDGAWGGETRYLPGLKVSNRGNPSSQNPLGAEKSYIMLLPYGADYRAVAGTNYRDCILAKHSLYIWGAFDDTGGNPSKILMEPGRIYMTGDSGPYLVLDSGSIAIKGNRSTFYTSDYYYKFLHQAAVPHNFLAKTNFEEEVTVGDVFTATPSSSALGEVTVHGRLSIDSYTTASTSGGYLYVPHVLVGDATSSDGTLYVYGKTECRGTLYCSGTVTGTIKSRDVKTDNYGNVLLYCYETPSPMFGDIGSGITDADGICYVQIDDIFSETTNLKNGYQVFLQKCGNGDIWVSEKHPNYFVVQGTPELPFDWEVKAMQKDYENTRLDATDLYMSQETAQNESKVVASYIERENDAIREELSRVTNDYETVYDFIDTIEQMYAHDAA